MLESKLSQMETPKKTKKKQFAFDFIEYSTIFLFDFYTIS